MDDIDLIMRDNHDFTSGLRKIVSLDITRPGKPCVYDTLWEAASVVKSWTEIKGERDAQMFNLRVRIQAAIKWCPYEYFGCYWLEHYHYAKIKEIGLEHATMLLLAKRDLLGWTAYQTMEWLCRQKGEVTRLIEEHQASIKMRPVWHTQTEYETPVDVIDGHGRVPEYFRIIKGKKINHKTKASWKLKVKVFNRRLIRDDD